MAKVLKLDDLGLGTNRRESLASTGFARPADTTAYAAGDAVTDSTTVPTALLFPNCAGQAGGSGLILSALLIDSFNQATKGQFELWLFTSPPVADNDNAVFTPTDAECRTLVGVVQLSSPFVGDATSGTGGNCAYQATGLNLPFRAASGTASLYGLLVVRNAYTPGSGERFDISLGIQHNQLVGGLP